MRKITQAQAIIIGAIITALIAGYFAVQANVQPIQLQIDATRTAEARTEHVLDLQISSGRQFYSEGQMIVLANEDGVAAIRFRLDSSQILSRTCEWGTDPPIRPCEALYQWRYLRYGSGLTDTGNGILFENYASTPIVGGTHLIDLGSQLNIDIKDIHVTWEPAWYAEPDIAISTGWIYYDNLGVNAIDESLFDTLDLSRVLVTR